MRNFTWIRKTLQRVPHLDTMRVVEWAAGDGGLGQHLHAHQTVEPLTGVDRWSRPADWPEQWSWHQGPLEDWTAFPEYPVVIGNFILHQFTDETLAQFGQSFDAHTSVLIFNETLRSRRVYLLTRHLRFLGAHPVTQYDALVSIRAGFLGDELPELLGLPPTRWSWTIQTTTLGSYRMVATRRVEAP